MEIKVDSYLNNDSFKKDHLRLRLKGKDINHVYVNTLRRVIIEEIPSYGINSDLINISKNSSVYNNDYLRNRIENFPLVGLNFKLDLEEYNNLRRYIRGIEDYNTEYEDNGIDMYLDVKNEDDTILNVTTDDIKYYINGQNVKSIYNRKMLICKLKKNEELNLSIKVDKGIGLNHSRYSVAHVYYSEEDSNNYLLTIEPRGQLPVDEILSRACEIIKYKLNLLNEKFEKQMVSDGIIVLNNEDHTMGNLITFRLQENKDIKFAGYELEHLLIKDLSIKYITKDSKSINSILKKEIEFLIKYYDNLGKEFNKLNKYLKK
jgi:DNA-directed RNA polymerase subunit L